MCIVTVSSLKIPAASAANDKTAEEIVALAPNDEVSNNKNPLLIVHGPAAPLAVMIVGLVVSIADDPAVASCVSAQLTAALFSTYPSTDVVSASASG